MCEFVASPHRWLPCVWLWPQVPHQPFHPDNKEPPAACTGGLLNEISYQSTNSCGLCLAVRSGYESPSAALNSYHLDVYLLGGKSGRLALLLCSKLVCLCGLWLPREEQQPLKKHSFTCHWFLDGSYPTSSSLMEFGLELLITCDQIMPDLIKSHIVAALPHISNTPASEKQTVYLFKAFLGVFTTFDLSQESKTVYMSSLLNDKVPERLNQWKSFLKRKWLNTSKVQNFPSCVWYFLSKQTVWRVRLVIASVPQ